MNVNAGEVSSNYLIANTFIIVVFLCILYNCSLPVYNLFLMLISKYEIKNKLFHFFV